ncbi:hypothetical protein ES703_40970 [subsurface metagenome]
MHFHSAYSININEPAFEDAFTQPDISLYLSLLDHAAIRGTVSGSRDRIILEQDIVSDYLHLPMTGEYYLIDSSFQFNAYNASVVADSIFPVPVRFDSIDISSSGKINRSPDIQYFLHLKKYKISDKSFEDLAFQGTFHDKQIEGSHDSLLSATIEHSIHLEENKSIFLSGNFQMLNHDLIRSFPSGLMSANFYGEYHEFDDSSFQAGCELTNFHAITSQADYLVENTNVKLDALQNGFSTNISSDFIQVDFISYINLPDFIDSIRYANMIIKNPDSTAIASYIPSLPNVKIDMKLTSHPIIDEFILKRKFAFGTLAAELITNETGKDQLNLTITEPELKGIRADIAILHAELQQNQFLMESSVLGVDGRNIIADQFHMKNAMKEGFAHTEIAALTDKDEVTQFVTFDINKSSGLYSINFPGDSLVLFGNPWRISTENLITFTNSFIDECNLELTSDKKIINIGRTEKCPLLFEVKNIDLTAIATLLLSEDELQGYVNCDICFLDDSLSSVRSYLSFNDVSMNNTELGTYDVQAYYNAHDTSSYEYGGIVRYEGKDKLQLTVVTPRDNLRKTTLDAKISDLTLDTFSPFLEKYLNEISGTISGFIKVNRDDSQPGIQGELTYSNLVVNPKMLNNTLSFNDNVISVKDRILTLNKIVAKDERGKKMLIDGKIKFPQDKDPSIFLKATGDSMVILNIPDKKVNPFFGKVVVTNMININGALQSPDIDLNLNLVRGTDFTYRIIEDLTTYAGEDVVSFVEHDTLLQHTDQEKSLFLSDDAGIELDAEVSINPNTVFRLVYDQNMKFDVELSGSGKINFQKKRTGKEQMIGKYSVNKGRAVLKLQGLAPKDFSISPESYVLWDGNASDPFIDINAYHRVKGSYENPAEGVTQTMIVDYDVMFAIKNRLNNPEIIIDVQTEDEYMATVLNIMTEEERLKQAINLLLLGQIITDNTKTSGSKIITDHINQFWAQQLNNAAAKNLGGVSVSVDIQSFTDYSAGNAYDRTNLSYEVSKEVWNNKATIKVGGYVSTYNNSPDQAPSRMIGDVSLEYKLNKKENLYGKVFSDHKYEGVLEGEIQRTGAGILYRQNYHSFKDIWRRRRTKKQQKKQDKEIEKNKVE